MLRMRLTARSRSIVASIPQDVPDELYESGNGPDHEENHIEEVCAESFVEEIADGITDEGGGRQEKGQRGVFANQRDEGFLAHGGFRAGGSSLAFEQRFGALGGFLDQQPHLRVARLEVGMNAVFLERFGGSRSNRGDQHF